MGPLPGLAAAPGDTLSHGQGPFWDLTVGWIPGPTDHTVRLRGALSCFPVSQFPLLSGGGLVRVQRVTCGKW